MDLDKLFLYADPLEAAVLSRKAQVGIKFVYITEGSKESSSLLRRSPLNRDVVPASPVRV